MIIYDNTYTAAYHLFTTFTYAHAPAHGYHRWHPHACAHPHVLADTFISYVVVFCLHTGTRKHTEYHRRHTHACVTIRVHAAICFKYLYAHARHTGCLLTPIFLSIVSCLLTRARQTYTPSTQGMRFVIVFCLDTGVCKHTEYFLTYLFFDILTSARQAYRVPQLAPVCMRTAHCLCGSMLLIYTYIS